MVWEALRRAVAALLVVKVLMSLPPCGARLCPESNYGPGPLNLTTPQYPGFDQRFEGQSGSIYRCLGNFTSFLWFKRTSDVDVPFPWGRGADVSLVCHNQTVSVHRLMMEDDGDYLYVASNGTHNVSGIFTQLVECKGAGSSFASQPQREKHVELGSRTALQCAANTNKCNFESQLHWLWINSTHSGVWLTNSTLPHVSVRCNTDNTNCSVLVDKVYPELFAGQFVCRFDVEPLNQTFTLLPPVKVETSWLTRIVVACVVVMVLVVTVGGGWWRYGHRVWYSLRRCGGCLPNRDGCGEDAELIHGEDHEELAYQHLRPGLRDLGYTVRDEIGTPGKPETLETAEAILHAHCVILAYSDLELKERDAEFIVKVTKLRAAHSVVFVRCKETRRAESNVQDTPTIEVSGINDAAIEERDADHTAIDRKRETPKGKEAKNVWNEEWLRVFKVLDWPGVESGGDEKSGPLRNALRRKRVDKFWYDLQGILPKPAKTSSREAHPSHRIGGRDMRSSNASQRRLLDSPTASPPSSTTDVRVREDDEVMDTRFFPGSPTAGPSAYCSTDDPESGFADTIDSSHIPPSHAGPSVDRSSSSSSSPMRLLDTHAPADSTHLGSTGDHSHPSRVDTASSSHTTPSHTGPSVDRCFSSSKPMRLLDTHAPADSTHEGSTGDHSQPSRVDTASSSHTTPSHTGPRADDQSHDRQRGNLDANNSSHGQLKVPSHSDLGLMANKVSADRHQDGKEPHHQAGGGTGQGETACPFQTQESGYHSISTSPPVSPTEDLVV